jgi:hypothetical protein
MLQGSIAEGAQKIPNTSNFDNYDDEKLSSLSLELEAQIELITLETGIFSSFLQRVLPNAQGEEPGGDGKEDFRSRRVKKDKAKDPDRPSVLTIEQKTDIATRELEEYRDKNEREKEEWTKIADNAKV